MSQLLKKSETSYSAAELLHKQCLFSSVAHCSYYSCFQMYKYIWLYPMDKTDDLLKNATNESFRKNLRIKGSHNILLDRVAQHIKTNNRDDFRVINTSINQLKKLRRTADYDDKDFFDKQSEKSIKLSTSIRKVLKKYIPQ